MRYRSRSLLLLAIASVGFACLGYWNATRDPIVRTARVAVADWPAGSLPLKLLLISDVHVAGPDTPPERLARIVERLNALRPDLVVIAGDLISEKSLATRIYTPTEAVAPLRGLRARLGVVAVLGNHDHWAGAAEFERALRDAAITRLENEAVQRGPLAIGGVGDEFTGHADVPATYRALAALRGPRILVTHDPDIVADLPETVAAVFAGHTHCGQATKPWSGEPFANVSRYGRRFQCGDITDKGQRLFVTAGLGTSVIWLRYGAPPDVWLVTIGPKTPR